MIKEKILKELEANNNYISGQQLAEKFGVSRTAIWKAVSILKKDGYKIESVNNKGYLLTDSDILSLESIRSYLSNSENKYKIILLDEIDSTNTEAKRLITENNCPDIIISKYQSLGRGRSGKSFYSPKNGGIYMTVILSPNTILDSAKLITCAAAVCVCRALEQLINIHPQIKWVNDIIYENKKICGILTEAVTDLESGNVEKIIIGIGINCSKAINLPKELKNIVGYVNLKPYDRNKLIALILEQIYSHIFDNPNKIITEYRSRSLMHGKTVTFEKNNQLITAVVTDINDEGNLIAKDINGNIHKIVSGIVDIKDLYKK